MTSGFPQGQYFYIKSKENGSCIDVYMGELTVSFFYCINLALSYHCILTSFKTV